MNSRETLETDLNVFERFDPKLSDASRQSDVLFLANILPTLQLNVRAQCTAAKFVARTRWTCGSTSLARRSSPRSPRSTA